MTFLGYLIGLLITGGAIFGSIYQVPSPTKLAPYYAVAWFVVGLIVTFVVKGREPAGRPLKCRE